jgi:hypothetical protein
VISVVKESIPDVVSSVLFKSPVRHVPGAMRIMNDAVWRSVEIYEGRLDGEVACVWGMIPPTLLSDSAYMWLLTTDIIAEHKFLFIRYSQRWVEEALKQWPTIYGDVIADNRAAKRWLGFLGAEFGYPQGGKIPFVIRRKTDG